jgi:hypothetical protein
MGESTRPVSGVLRRLLRAISTASAAALATLGLVHVVQLGRVMGSRVDYPYDLEWMEGGQLYHAQRLLNGASLYRDCTDGFLPFPYPPVHALTVAAAGATFGMNYLVARLVGVVAFAFIVGLLAREVFADGRPRGRRVVLSAMAAGGIAASFPITGGWYDLVRVDSVYFAFLLAGARLALPPRARAGTGTPERLSTTRAIASAACLAAALYGKQTAVFFLPPIALYAWWRYGRRGLAFGSLTALFCVAPGAWLTWRGDGFFWSMMVDVMGHHPLVELQAREAALRGLVFAPPLALLPFATLWLARLGRLHKDLAFWLLMLLTAAIASIVTSAKVGAFQNNLMTLCVLAWPVTAMVVAELLDAYPRRKSSRSVITIAATWLAIAHFARLSYEPGKFVPSRRHRASVRELYRLVGELEGGVIAPGHSFLPVLAGHDNVQIHEQGYIDIMGAGLKRVDVIDCFGKLDSRWLLLDDASQPHMRALIDMGYRRARRLPTIARTPVGMYTRPVALYERVDDAPIFAERRRVRPLFDFEDGNYDGWEVEGQAFDWGPSTPINGFQSPVGGQRGGHFADSFHPQALDAAVGRLTSPPFTIDRHRLGFRVGGGRSKRLSVELLIDGDVKQSLVGAGQNFEMLGPIVWDVSDLVGRSARLRLVDAETGGWGHLMVDAVELFDPDTASAP